MSTATRHGCTALAAVLAAVVLAACGSGSTPVSDEQGAQAVVLEASELPPGSTVAKRALVSEECSPVTYFQSYATAVADPFGFLLPEAELLQTVGVFKNTKQARKAFAEVTSKSARDCVGAELQRTARQLAGESGNLSSKAVPRSLPGEVTRTMRLELFTLFAGVGIERTAILHGRLLTTLTFISKSQPLSEDLWDSVTHYAADLIDETASSIEGETEA